MPSRHLGAIPAGLGTGSRGKRHRKGRTKELVPAPSCAGNGTMVPSRRLGAISAQWHRHRGCCLGPSAQRNRRRTGAIAAAYSGSRGGASKGLGTGSRGSPVEGISAQGRRRRGARPARTSSLRGTVAAARSRLHGGAISGFVSLPSTQPMPTSRPIVVAWVRRSAINTLQPARPGMLGSTFVHQRAPTLPTGHVGFGFRPSANLGFGFRPSADPGFGFRPSANPGFVLRPSEG